MSSETKKQKVLIAPNSFKECADSVTIANLFKENLNAIPNTDLIVKPISDGGDGFIRVCKFYFGGEILKYEISTAYNQLLLECPILYVAENKTIYMETAEILGLKVVPNKFRNPLKLSSKGIGELLLKIINDSKSGKISVDKIYLGVGGTATIDMGLGMMSKFGLKLYDDNGCELSVLPENFNQVIEIKWNKIDLPFDIIPIADVANQLTGEDGGVMVYGKQKGAIAKDLVDIDFGFSNIINLLKNKKLVKSLEFLSGAGGGIPASFQIFFDSYCKSSYEFVLNDLKLDYRFNKFDYLITGEGAFDRQTLFGKGAGLLMMYYANKVRRIFLVCGKIDVGIKEFLPQNAVPIELLSYFEDKDQSIKNYRFGINKACGEIGKQIQF